ncbi:MAG TPA: AAA family ATPase [Saprospiraceae bacterium]|nr:AAA family ATPase [Saprospiraceae bacterium]
MRYKKFTITGYRGLKDNTEIDISKSSLYPIIGKNESGKTTCLEAIHTFDFSNDSEHSGKHLNNIENLYSTVESPISITAEIEVDSNIKLNLFEEEFKVYQEEFIINNPDSEFNLISIDTDQNKYTNWQFIKSNQILHNKILKSETLYISRDLRTKKYSIQILLNLLNSEEHNKLGEDIVRKLPYTLFFDDFRDRIPEKLFIIREKENENYSKWIEYINELFQSTDENYSVFNLPEKGDSKRRSIIKEVEKYLNERLIEEWSSYQFESTKNIQVQIEYHPNNDKPYLQFKIIENIYVNGILKERFFDISDRSKGFYWYFNFMIKLHFNPSKRNREDKDTIYLLDEPGSYLHTYALNKLAEQLKKLSVNNKVIYCTHSHNLLNPKFIPINSIRLAEKTNNGIITINQLDHKGIVRPNKNSAYQSIYDALEVRPPLVEYDFDNVILLEGIYDYYSFSMFTENNLAYFPCVSASSINNQIPYMIFLGKKYLALWDNDNEGRTRREKALNQFGEVEGRKFLILNQIGENQITRLEEYFDNNELEKYRKEVIGTNQAFEKTVLELFYSENKKQNILKYFKNTKKNFQKMEQVLIEKLDKQK